MTAETLFLPGETARRLYEDVKGLPIIDYHNHLSAEDLRTDRVYTDAYEVWVARDPYKHRVMRMCGVPERYVTGDAPAGEKFAAWWRTLPRLVGNPLSVWSAMELERVFGWDAPADGKDADKVLEGLNRRLAEKRMTLRSLLREFSVEAACPCAGFGEDVAFYGADPGLAPSLRGDDGTKPTPAGVEKLARMTGTRITDLDSMVEALHRRLDAFEAAGCRFADHALDSGFHYLPPDGSENGSFRELLAGRVLGPEEALRLECRLLEFLLGEYADRGLTVQLHCGAQRATSGRLRTLAGSAGGFAAIGETCRTGDLAALLDRVEREKGKIPRTILFCMSPGDFPAYAGLSGSFSADGEAGILTLGPAWWWCDHKAGMEAMLEASASFGLLWISPGMTTDSRSPLSFVRHDYFRRVLCGWAGEKYDRGEWICEPDTLRALARRLCLENARTLWRE